MIDLQDYRMRIGMFSHGNIYKNAMLYQKKVISSTFQMLPLTLVCLLGFLCIQMVNDPSIEQNPGPSQTYSGTEKPLVDKLKTVNKDIARISSHRFFMTSCLDLQLIPRSLNQKFGLATTNANAALLNELKNINNENAFQKMSIIVNHYSAELGKLQAVQNTLLNDLKSCTSSDRYHDLYVYLQNISDSLIYSLQQEKIRKIDKELSFKNDTTGYWLPNLKLSHTERNFITNNEELCDKIINASASLLMAANPLLHIQSASLTHEFLHYQPMETIHIHHNGHGHFVTSSSLGNKVVIFDSLNSNPTQELISQISTLYSPDKDITPTTHLCVMPAEQKGSVDCGLFSIAYATDLAFGNDPSKVVYDQSAMRDHLLLCLESNSISIFPRHCILSAQPTSKNVTGTTDKTKIWSAPKKSARCTSPSPTTPISLSNKFQCLDTTTSVNTQSVDFTATKDSIISNHSKNKSEKANPQHSTDKSTVINLSSRILSREKVSILRFDLPAHPKFCC